MEVTTNILLKAGIPHWEIAKFIEEFGRDPVPVTPETIRQARHIGLDPHILLSILSPKLAKELWEYKWHNKDSISEDIRSRITHLQQRLKEREKFMKEEDIFRIEADLLNKALEQMSK